MKKVLITGINSYVGNSFGEWIAQYPEKYQVEKISLRDDSWQEENFSQYDSIVHVAGIAHVSKDPKLEEEYYKINRDLTIKIAEKAKAEGVNQFIFMSSIIVYGNGVKKDGVINRNTIPKPRDFYGKSKLQAEEGITLFNDANFKVAIIRPPMIYGKDSKGNYPRLAKVARKLPIFPNFDNKRSMLHIDNLSEFLRLMIENEENGLFFPQNKEYVKTSEMVRLIAKVHGKKIKLVHFSNPILKIMKNRIEIINKVFGDLVYDQELSKYKEAYHSKNLYESIKATELETDL